MVAEHADVWHSFGDLETFKRKSAVLEKWCAEVGRDPQAIGRSIGIGLGRIDRADAYVAAGVTEFTLGLSGPDYDLASVPDWIAWRDDHNRV
jgi:hypothetical protein